MGYSCKRQTSDRRSDLKRCSRISGALAYTAHHKLIDRCAMKAVGVITIYLILACQIQANRHLIALVFL